jgi:hypothetical protein
MEVVEKEQAAKITDSDQIVESKLKDAIDNGKLRVEVHQTEGFVKTSFTNNQNIHLNNSIRFADTKAGALVAVNGLIAKFAFDTIAGQTRIVQYGLSSGLLLLVISIALSVFVVIPRKVKSKEKGIIYWENMIEMDMEEYIEAIENMEPQEMRKHALMNNYIQAEILTKKFDVLRKAFITSLLGASIFAVVTIFVFFVQM